MIKMGKYKCPFCGEGVEDKEVHMKHMHPEIIEKEEMKMLNEIRRQQYFLMEKLKEKNPSLYTEFLEKLSEEDNIKIKIMCVKEFILMNEMNKAEEIVFEVLENGDKEAYMEILILYKNMGKKERAIDLCKKAMEKFDKNREEFKLFIEEMED
ncbi:MAG TPA: hypothetical protein ENI33_03260 [Thermoplasmatales archaeon]|nr:hypothetical protein [Thermoplasmatales archaeon]